MADSTPHQNPRLDFGNLPLVEAAVRASFKQPVKLTFGVVNGMHDRLRGRFPQVSEPERIEFPPGISEGTVPMGPGQIPGVLYTGNPDGLVVSVQSQVVVARWLRRVGGAAPEYPRYKDLGSALWEAVEALREECGVQSFPVVVVNMSYVNFLDIEDPAHVLETYFSRLVQIEVTENVERLHKVEVSWCGRDSVDLRFRLEQVSAKVDERTEEGYRLTTAAGVRLNDTDCAEEKLDQIHVRLLRFFRDVISDRAKEEWQLKE